MKKQILAALIVFCISHQGFGDCTEDDSTSTPVGIPAAIQADINTLTIALKGPIKIYGQTITLGITINPNMTINEENCVDDDNCTCGTYDTGTGTLSVKGTASATLKSITVGPFNVTAWDTPITISGDGTVTVNGTGSVNSNIVSKTDCSGTLTYSTSNTFNQVDQATGSMTGSVTVTILTVPVTITDIISVTGTETETATFSISDAATPSASWTVGNPIITATADLSAAGVDLGNWSFGITAF